MPELIGYILSGLVSGALYALLASGLVLAYSASGVFNFGHGAVAFLGAFVLFQLVASLHWPVWLSAVTVVATVGVLLGWALARLMFHRLAEADETGRVVGTISLLIALPALGLWGVERLVVDLGLDLESGHDVARAPGLGPSPTRHWTLMDGVVIDSNQVVILVLAAVTAMALWLVLHGTRLGLSMRATVDRRELASLRGVDTDRTTTTAWMLSGTIAAVAGMAAAPVLGLSARDFIMITMVSATAAILGGLRSIPLAFGCGLALGVVQNLVAGYATFARDVLGFRTAVPFFLLFALLFVIKPAGRVAGTRAEDAPPPDPLAHLAGWRRALPWAVAAALLAAYIALAAGDYAAGLIVQGLAMAIVFMSFTIVTGIGGMANLATAAFVSVAGCTAGLLLHHGWPLALALLAAVAVATATGLLVALPALRLGGLVLALATLALALIGDYLVFQIEAVGNLPEGWTIPRPALGPVDLADDRVFALCLLALVCALVWMIRNLPRSRTGRAALAVRSAPAAAVMTGVSLVRVKLSLFALGAAVAGLGGVLLAMYNQQVIATDFTAVAGFTWFAIVVVMGVRSPGAAVLAGLFFAVFPAVLGEYVSESPHLAALLFGLGGIGLARNPDGAMHMMAGLRSRLRRKSRSGPRSSARVADRPASPSPDDLALLDVRGLVAGYGSGQVLHGIDLRVEEGRCITLLGPNGAGKSTLCRCLAGTLPSSGGRTFLDGQDVTGWSVPRRTRAGLLLVPEGRGVFPGLTTDENLRVRLPDAADRDRVYDRFARLAQRRAQSAGVLSGGEQQILALAPLLVRPPRVLLADEPSLGLAPLIVEEILELFGELKERGTAILLTAEKPGEALRVADTVAVLRGGTILWSGPSAEADPGRLADAYLGLAGAKEAGR
ncbi:ATP-binding cassette domain-containing protein [Actinomadura sp. SCN-SB]|uniref:ABC transporter permease subunit n=1 Tax=Actinomadura sp. SCN-SB TaxID=3373092 RepID=UPI0037529C5C